MPCGIPRRHPLLGELTDLPPGSGADRCHNTAHCLGPSDDSRPLLSNGARSFGDEEPVEHERPDARLQVGPQLGEGHVE